MMPRLDPAIEAKRLRLHREAFELAQACKITLPEARLRLAEARWDARDAQRARCGTQAPANAVTPSPRVPIDDSDEGLMWWQK